MLVLTQDAQARGLPVYVLLLPANMEQHGQIQEPVMGTALRNTGAVVGGHALPDPSCWGQVDHGHPSEKGASVLADLATRLVIEGKSLPGMAMTRCGQ